MLEKEKKKIREELNQFQMQVGEKEDELRINKKRGKRWRIKR